MLNIPDPQGFIIFIIISVLYSVALVPISLTALPSPDITAHKSMSLKRLYSIAPVGVVGCIVSGVMVGSIYTLGAIYAERTGLSMKATSLFMFFYDYGRNVGPAGGSDKLSDRMDRRFSADVGKRNIVSHYAVDSPFCQREPVGTGNSGVNPRCGNFRDVSDMRFAR